MQTSHPLQINLCLFLFPILAMHKSPPLTNCSLSSISHWWSLHPPPPLPTNGGKPAPIHQRRPVCFSPNPLHLSSASSVRPNSRAWALSTKSHLNKASTDSEVLEPKAEVDDWVTKKFLCLDAKHAHTPRGRRDTFYLRAALVIKAMTVFWTSWLLYARQNTFDLPFWNDLRNWEELPNGGWLNDRFYFWSQILHQAAFPTFFSLSKFWINWGFSHQKTSFAVSPWMWSCTVRTNPHRSECFWR